MADGKEKFETQAKGFWYETLPNGRRAICFRVKVHGKKIIQKLELPPQVEELKPAG